MHEEEEATKRESHRPKGHIDGSDDCHDKGQGQGKLLLSLHAGFDWQDHPHPLIRVDDNTKQEWKATGRLELYHLSRLLEGPKVVIEHNYNACSTSSLAAITGTVSGKHVQGTLCCPNKGQIMRKSCCTR